MVPSPAAIPELEELPPVIRVFLLQQGQWTDNVMLQTDGCTTLAPRAVVGSQYLMRTGVLAATTG